MSRASFTVGAGARLDLPERFRGSDVGAIAIGDTIAALVAIIATSLLVRDLSSAVIAAFTMLAIAWLIGRYHCGFSRTARDELYAASAIALLGAPVAFFIATRLGYTWIGAVLAAGIWTGLAAAFAARALRTRRGERIAEGSAAYVRDWHRRRLGMEFERALIRVLDVVFTVVAGVLLAPVMLAIAVMIRRNDGPPIIFRQVRVGQHDRNFVMLKFRTMREDAGAAWVVPGDDRITPFGAFLRRSSLDELPQLWNVLIGNMSLVGPRPEMRDYVDRFSAEAPTYWQRHLVRPGLTGWAQISLTRNVQPTDMPHVLRSDLFYVENASLYLYLFCLAKTAFELVSHRGL